MAPSTAATLQTADLREIYKYLAAIAPEIGISVGALTTLRAMIACVRPERGTLICFASTATLLRLRSGGAERTLRMHVEQLIKAGIVHRNDSPNRKRYAAIDRCTHQSTAYGFDLTPMVQMADHWSKLAEQLTALESRRRYLRTVALGYLHQLDCMGSEVDTDNYRKILRRKLSLDAIEAIHEDILSKLSCLDDEVPPGMPVFEDSTNSPTLPDNEDTSAGIAVSDGNFCRHYSRSKTDNNESEEPVTPIATHDNVDEQIMLRTAVAVCTEAQTFSSIVPRSWEDLHRLANMLGPMMGISSSTIQFARSERGDRIATLTLLLIVQMGSRVRSAGAYFRSLMVGARSTQFNPLRLLRSMAAA